MAAGTLLMAGCGDCDMKVYFHAQNSFNNDHLVIRVDGNTVYDKQVTTNQLIGLADVDSLFTSSGQHQVIATVNDIYSDTVTTWNTPVVYLGIQFNSPGPLSMPPYGVFISQTEQQFFYE